MSGYYYKNLNIANITTSTSNTSNNYFVGFPTGTMGGNLFKPIDFGYIDNVGDLSNRCRARSTTITGKGNAVPPTGAKAFRYILIGGGGGGGGGGGHAHIGNNLDNKMNSNAVGGNGAAGAGAKYVYSNAAVKINSGNIYVNIGAGGNGANGGPNDNANVSSKVNMAGVGGYDGRTYNNTNSTYKPTAGGTTYFTYDGTQSPDAPGGAAGGWGKGGWAQMTTSGNKDNTNGGNTTDPGNQSTSVTINTNLGGNQLSNYGLGGGGGRGAENGNDAATAGGNGIQGAIQLIWLYE